MNRLKKLISELNFLLQFNSIFKIFEFVIKKIKGKQNTIKIKIFNNHIILRTNPSDLKTLKNNMTDEFDFLKDEKFKNINTIYDCGSFIGGSVIKFSKLFPNSKIYSYEPNNENFELLKKNTAFIKNIKINNLAISNVVAQNQLYGSEKGVCSYTLIKNDNNYIIQNIQSSTIENEMKKNGNKFIDLIKIDIEGSEFKIFENEKILNFLGIIVIEIHKSDDKDYLIKKILKYKKNCLEENKYEKFIFF
tara:strand:- start:2830 stop:3573 length:744 start_codon:yes stop_codon:yes gene_type:complete